MSRKNRILIVEIVGGVAALFLGILLFIAASALAEGIGQAAGDAVSTAPSQELGDGEGYALLAGLTLADLGVIALIFLAGIELALTIPSLLFAIVARVSHRPGKRGRYAILTVASLAPLAIVAVIECVFASGGTLVVFWISMAAIEIIVIAYSVFQMVRMLKEDEGVAESLPASSEDAR